MAPLVVLSAGTHAQVRSLQAELAVPLARSLGLVWGDQWQNLSCADPPHRALQLLADLPVCESPGLVGLPLDPGLVLQCGGHWAEALGAWRQPALMLLAAGQLETGLPAAMTALLKHWQVPLVGLVQGGGPWDREARRRDGLPWLGAISPGQGAWDPQLGQVLAAALKDRSA